MTKERVEGKDDQTKGPVRDALAAERPSTVHWAERELLIASAAYFRAQERGFAPGHELEDWLAAETEVDMRLASKSA